MIRYCPKCKTKKPMVKAGITRRRECGYARQRWQCTNKRCRRITVNPLKEK